MKNSSGAVVKVLTAAEVAAAASRLSKQRAGKTVGARDYDDWKRKNDVGPGQKVFSMTGW